MKGRLDLTSGKEGNLLGGAKCHLTPRTRPLHLVFGPRLRQRRHQGFQKVSDISRHPATSIHVPQHAPSDPHIAAVLELQLRNEETRFHSLAKIITPNTALVYNPLASFVEESRGRAIKL